MYDDSFKTRYKKLPIAIAETISNDTPPHLHNEIEIVYVISGTAKLTIAGISSEVSAGDLIFVNPVTVHSIIPDDITKFYSKCVCFDASLIVDPSMRNDIQNNNVYLPQTLKSNNYKYLQDNFISLYKCVENAEESLLFECTAYISLLFALLMKNDLFSKTTPSKKNNTFCTKVMEYISAHYSEEISSKDIADYYFYTQSSFCRAFVNNFGTSFSEYLNTYRISKAKLILEDENKKITDVALECGFSSSTYFSKCFKKYVGIAPSQYQKHQY